jgi:methylglutaconyl-CoA hydratase
MKQYTTIITKIENSVAKIWLNRPQVKNAMDDRMIFELQDILRVLNDDRNVRIIVLTGRGETFCAGADLKWMQHAQQLSFEENYKDSLKLSECFYELYNNRKITIAAINGDAYGGALGLICACDLSFCNSTVSFAFSEVKLGLIPATIVSYVIRKIGRNHTMELMLSGKKIDGLGAERIGLVNKTLNDKDFEIFIEEYIRSLLNNAPHAQQNIKHLINYLDSKEINKELIKETAEFIANARISDEAKEGITAFFEKRYPVWTKE